MQFDGITSSDIDLCFKCTIHGLSNVMTCGLRRVGFKFTEQETNASKDNDSETIKKQKQHSKHITYLLFGGCSLMNTMMDLHNGTIIKYMK